MKPTGLYWRIGLPFLVLMLTASVTIAFVVRSRIAAQARQQLAELAQANATFIERNSFPTTEKLAADLRRATGFDVYFRLGGRVVPTSEDGPPAAALLALEADGEVHALGDRFEAVGRPVLPRGEVLLVRTAEDFADPRIVQIVVASWLLALVLAVVVVRGLVRPLRNLAALLPRIEEPEPLRVPESGRGDEIGDVARALERTHRDLHEERERRLQAEKLAVLGRMTASLAHQVQNPVAAIKMQAQLWRTLAPSSDAGGDAPALIESEASRIERLLNQWMYLTRPAPPTLVDGDVGQLLDDVMRAHSARFDHAGVRAKVDRQGDLRLRCDRTRLGHVFDNLVANAVQAMPEGGELQVRARGDEQHVRIDFVDQGPGFSDAALERLGEFFFSEKEGGMGIGLAVVREVVAAHGGRFEVENLPVGARVTVELPRAGKARKRTNT